MAERVKQHFKKFKTAVADQFAYMQQFSLYTTQTDNTTLWETYLGSFPRGSNPQHRQRTDHDCNLCKEFVFTVGNVVAKKGNELISLWDVTVDDPSYKAVAQALSAYVKSQPLGRAYVVPEPTIGWDTSVETVAGATPTQSMKVEWEHFFIDTTVKYGAPSSDNAEVEDAPSTPHNCFITITTPEQLPAAVVGVEYPFQFATEQCGDANNLEWYIQMIQPYPEGIHFHNGALFGAPVAEGAFVVEVGVTMGGTGDAHCASTSKRFALHVGAEQRQELPGQSNDVADARRAALIAQLMGILEHRIKALEAAALNNRPGVPPNTANQENDGDNGGGPAVCDETGFDNEQYEAENGVLDHVCYLGILTDEVLPNTAAGDSYSVQLTAEHCGGDSAIVVYEDSNQAYPGWVRVTKDGVLTVTPVEQGKFCFVINAYLFSPGQEHYTGTEKQFEITVTAATTATGAADTSASYDVIQKGYDRINEMLGETEEDRASVRGLPAICFGEVVCGYGKEQEPVSNARIVLEGWVDASADAANEELYAVSGESGKFTIHMPDKYNFRGTVRVTVQKGAVVEVFRKRSTELIQDKGDLGTLVLSSDFLRGAAGGAGYIAPDKKPSGLTIAAGEGNDGFAFSTDDTPGMQFSYSLLHRLIEPEIGAFDGTIAYQWSRKEGLVWPVIPDENKPSLTVSYADEFLYRAGCYRCRVTYTRADGAKKTVYSPVTVVSTNPSEKNPHNQDRPALDAALVSLVTNPVIQIKRGQSVVCKVSASMNAFELARSKITAPVSIGEYKDALFADLNRITRMRSLGMGYVLKMTQSWKPDGFALGTLLYSTVLAPGEQQRLVVRERSESYTVQDTDDSAAAITETYDVDQSDNISHIYNQAVQQYDEAHSKSVVKTTGWSIGGGASGGVGGGGASAMLSVSGGYQNTKTTATMDSEQSHSLDTASAAASTFQRLIKGAAERLTQAKRVGIRMATGSESDSVSTKLISNHNHSHSLTMQYWEVVRKYKLETCVDDVSLVVYIPLELIDFGTGNDVFTEMSALCADEKYKSNPARLLTDRYGALLRYHDVLRAYLPAEQQAGLSVLRKFSALPKWDLEKIGANDGPTTLTIHVKGSFMPYDRLSVKLHLKNGRVIEGFQTRYDSQPMPPQTWEDTWEEWTWTEGIDTRQKLFRKLEDSRRNDGKGDFGAEIIVPADVIDDDYDYVEIAHSYDSQVTYDLYQSREAIIAYNDYKHKMLNSVEDNRKTAYDIMKADFHKILAEAVMDPIVILGTEQLRGFGPPVISSVTMTMPEPDKENTNPLTAAIEKCKVIKADIRGYLDKVIKTVPFNPSEGESMFILHKVSAITTDLLGPLFTAAGIASRQKEEVSALTVKIINLEVARISLLSEDPRALEIISDYGKILDLIVREATLAGAGKQTDGKVTKTLGNGKLKLDGSLRFQVYDSMPTMHYADLQKIETMKRHVLENGVYYSQAVWASLSSDERALLFEKYTIEMPASTEVLVDVDGNDDDSDNDNTVTSTLPQANPDKAPNENQNKPLNTKQDNILIPSMNKTQGTSFPLMNCVINQPLGFYGNCMVLPFVYPPKLAEILGTTSAGLQNALYRYHTQAFRVPTATLSLPTTGMMGDAMLGKNNASEKIDLTRFWNWSDAPIPESDKITSEYFKSGNLLDERVAPASSLPEGAVTTMPITASLLDSVAASNVLQSMVAKPAPTFADLSGYNQLQGMTTSESQARTQLAQQTAQTTQKALETAMQQQNALQQANAVEESLNKALGLAQDWRLEAEGLEKDAAAATAEAAAERAKKVVAAPGATLGAEEQAANDNLETTAKEHEASAKEYRSRALQLRTNAAEVEKSVITTHMTAMSNIYAPAKATAATADKDKASTSEGKEKDAAEGKGTAEGKGK